MSNQKYSFDFSFLKAGFWTTIFLAILKIANVLPDISLWWVFAPLLIGIGGVLFIIFLIGLIIVYIISVRGIDLPDDTGSEAENENNS